MSANVRGSGTGSLRLADPSGTWIVPGRSYAQTLVNSETAVNTGVNVEPGASTLHWLAASPPPDSRMTVGLPSPRHSRYTERPDGNSTSPATSSTVSAAGGDACVSVARAGGRGPAPERDPAQDCDHDTAALAHSHRARMRRSPSREQLSSRKEKKCQRL